MRNLARPDSSPSTSERPAARALRGVGFASLFLSLLLAAATHADDWPQWRGPDRTGVSAETGLLRAFCVLDFRLAQQRHASRRRPRTV